MAKISKEMEAILRNPQSARDIHRVAMTDGHAVVKDNEGNRYVVFTRNGARGIRLKETRKKSSPSFWQKITGQSR